MPLSAVEIIRKLGFQAEHARNAGLVGCSDKEIAAYAKKHNAILVTKDIEFGSLLLYPKGSHYGLLILRLPHYFTSKQIMETLEKFLTEIKPTILVNSITVLEIGRYRIRRIS